MDNVKNQIFPKKNVINGNIGMEKIVDISQNLVLWELIGMELIVLQLDLVLRDISKEKLNIVNHFHSFAYLQQFGMDKFVRQIIINVLTRHFIMEVFVCHMFLVKMVRFGVHLTSIVFVQMELKIMEMFAYLVQIKKYGYQV